jgi:hypothetical protein
MKITAKNSIKYKGRYIAPGETFDAVKAVADDLLKQGVASLAVVNTAEVDAGKVAAAEESAMIEKINAANLEAGEARWKELADAGSVTE